MMNNYEEFPKRLSKIRDKIYTACQRAGRDDAERICLVAVSKRFPVEAIEIAIRCGLNTFGENYVQEGVSKVNYIREKGYNDIKWHFIGHLQKNKVRPSVDAFDVIETVDSIALLKRINRIAGERKRRIRCLVQINISRDPQKSGIIPEDAHDFFSSILNEIELCNVTVCGLMTILAKSSSVNEIRGWYRSLKALRDELMSRFSTDNIRLSELSMGMSNDFEIAIEEGATIVRIGQALFGEREGAQRA